ncbi:MAG: MlaD family protein [Verrucomicrobiota bacterium]
MNETRINALIALTTVAAAILMAAALSYAIGKWSFGDNGYHVTIKFPNATGISPNSEVKLAGVLVGRVRSVTSIPRHEQDLDPKEDEYNCVAVLVSIDKGVDIGNDVEATVKQDGFGIAPRYILLTPGHNPDAPALADNDVLQGEPAFDFNSLIQPAGEALTKAQKLVEQLEPMMKQLSGLTNTLSKNLPPLLDNANKFLTDGDGVLSNFNSPDGKRRLVAVLDSLRVSTENLKVVTSNAKALTATLAEKPWRIIWGGPTVKPPPEGAVLDSTHVIRLKPDVDVNPDEPVPAGSK